MKITFQQIKTLWSHTRRLGIKSEHVYRILNQRFKKKKLHELSYYEAAEWIYDLSQLIRRNPCGITIHYTQEFLVRKYLFSQQMPTNSQIHRVILILRAIQHWDPQHDILYSTEDLADKYAKKIGSHYKGWRKLNRWQIEFLINILKKELDLIKEICKGGQYV